MLRYNLSINITLSTVQIRWNVILDRPAKSHAARWGKQNLFECDNMLPRRRRQPVIETTAMPCQVHYYYSSAHSRHARATEIDVGSGRSDRSQLLGLEILGTKRARILFLLVNCEFVRCLHRISAQTGLLCRDKESDISSSPPFVIPRQIPTN